MDADLAMKQVMGARDTKALPTKQQMKYLPHLLSKKERRIALIALALVIIAGLFLARQLVNSSRVNAPAVGGEYTEGLIGSPQLINPLYALTSDVDTDLTALIYSGLMRYDSVDGLVADLAESYTISDDELTYTFVLREDARWHDGRRVLAEDVVFTISAIQNMEYRSPLEASFAEVSAEQVDERTVRITLAEPFAPFLSLLTIGILPSHVWQEITPINAALTELNIKPIGSGPYVFEKLVKDSKGEVLSYTLERNPDYYGEAPNIATLTFKFYNDLYEGVEALRNHNVEGLSYLPLSEVEDFEDENSLQLVFPAMNQYTALFFNDEQQSILDDSDVRKALQSATDKQAVIDVALGGYGEVIHSFILEGMIGSGAKIDEPSYDPDAARDQLEEAGWILPEDSDVRTNDDETLSLEIVTFESTELIATAEEIKRQWSEVGVFVSITSVNAVDFQNSILKNRDYDILLSGELYGIDPDPYAFWHSSQADYPGLNLAQYKNRDADEYIETGRSTADESTRAVAYEALQLEILDHTPAIFLYQPLYSYATSSKINGIEMERIVVPADRFSRINTWYIKSRKVFGEEGAAVEETTEEAVDEEVVEEGAIEEEADETTETSEEEEATDEEAATEEETEETE